MSKHIIISGTGRAGTTFLVQLLTQLGLDTGFSIDNLSEKIFKEARAGLEHNLRQGKAPYIIKDPYFCDYAEEIIDRKSIVIEHVFIPIRNAAAAAESRWRVSQQALKKQPFMGRILCSITGKTAGHVKGGLWGTNNQRKQKRVLEEKLYRLMLSLSKRCIAVTLLHYPTLAKDVSYLYKKLKPVLREIDFKSFDEAFQRTSNPDFIRSFDAEDI